ncbi:suppressor of kinetochore protein mutant [Tyrophagus putrescentiae]|nr:suppressor of kinetochore protein mutant [Tyrophagus putrescentiae]
MAGTIKLKSFDKQIFEVELSAARLSPKLMELVNSKGTVDEIALEEENLTGDILNRILTWCTRHQNDTEEQLAVSDSDEDEYEQWTMHKNRRSLFLKKHHKPLPPISKWDRQFLAAESNSTLYSMIIGARFLKIKKLRSLTCSTVMYRLKNMSTNELRTELCAISDLNKIVNNDDDDDIHLESIDNSRRG